MVLRGAGWRRAVRINHDFSPSRRATPAAKAPFHSPAALGAQAVARHDAVDRPTGKPSLPPQWLGLQSDAMALEFAFSPAAVEQASRLLAQRRFLLGRTPTLAWPFCFPAAQVCVSFAHRRGRRSSPDRESAKRARLAILGLSMKLKRAVLAELGRNRKRSSRRRSNGAPGRPFNRDSTGTSPVEIQGARTRRGAGRSIAFPPGQARRRGEKGWRASWASCSISFPPGQARRRIAACDAATGPESPLTPRSGLAPVERTIEQPERDNPKPTPRPGLPRSSE